MGKSAEKWKRRPENSSRPLPDRSRSYFAAPALQVLETFFTLVTLKVLLAPAEEVLLGELLLEAEDPAEAAPLEAEEPEALAVPFTSTSLLTCEASFEVSPSS